MNSDYPPLPHPGGQPIAPVSENTQILLDEMKPKEMKKKISSPRKDSKRASRDSSSFPVVICPDGDMIIEYAESSSTGNRRWQVSSKPLMRNSPYFRALLDPNKFVEGKLVAEYKQRQAQNGIGSNSVTNMEGRLETLGFDLPVIKISETHLTKLCGAEAIELFLKILCADGLSKDQRLIFESELRVSSPSIVERTIEIAESFSSPNIVRDTLRRVWYVFGKTKISLNKFSGLLLKSTEDRVRQIIIIAAFIGETTVAKIMMHTLLVMGSKYWDDGPEQPSTNYLRWRYLGKGIEEELYYRRQCVMNTITDLQAHFLRVYGGLGEIPDTHVSKPAPSRATLGTSFSSSNFHREYQCRAGLGNGSQCDLFHLGQMTRFFALRSKSIFLGSTLIDPDFRMDDEEDDDDVENGGATPASYSGPPSDIISIFASMKQYPDYQIDPNHQGCGVRRRILPVLNGIEKFILDPRGLLGIDLQEWEDSSKRPQIQWSSKTNRKKHVVDIRFEKIVCIHMSANFSLARAASPEEDAKLLFTARKRNWES